MLPDLLFGSLTRRQNISENFKQLFSLLISYDPCSRLTIEEARAHKWVSGYIPNQKDIDSEFLERTKVVQYKKELERRKEEDRSRLHGTHRIPDQAV